MSDLERLLISKMISVKEIAKIWDAGLRPDVFEEPINRAIFEWFVDYWLDSHMQAAPTWVVVEAEFPSIKLETSVEETTEWLIEELKRRWVTNQAQDIMRRAAGDLSTDPLAVMGRMWREAYDVTEVTAERFARADMATNVDTRRQWYDARARAEATDGVPFGLPGPNDHTTGLDAHTRGLLPGELAAVAAYTKTGKTFLLGQFALGAREAGFTPIFFTLEMTVREVQERIDALASQVSYEQLQEGRMLADDRARLHRAQEELREQGPILVERPPRGQRTVKNLISRARQAGANYVLIDQLSFMDGEREYHGDKAITQRHGDIIFELKDEIARESAGALPCALAVQLNRETMRQRDQGGRGALNNFAHSSMIEQTVDLALGLWRSNEMRANHTMGLDIMGSRRCDLMSWLLHWRLHDRSQIAIREVYDG